jgi:sec-independent protein translocase protein TatC
VPRNSADPEKTMSFWDHLSEMRFRLLVSAAALLAGTIACFAFVEPAAALILQPAGDMRFVYLSPPELFMSYLRISLTGGLVLASPVILFQAWLFARPGLSKRERSALLAGLILGAGFFIIGAVFSFLVVVPFTLRFFSNYQSESVVAMYSISEYIGFVGSMVFSFGMAFEMPMVATLLSALGIVTGTGLAKVRGIAILVIFIAAAVLTPPDVVSQVMLGVPMVLLFELSVLLARGQEKRRRVAAG